MRCSTCGKELGTSREACPDCCPSSHLSDPTADPTPARRFVADHTTQTRPLPRPEYRRLVPGTLLDRRYRIVGPLGRGGMGEVYKAEDLRLGQDVALKFLPTAVTHDPAWLRRLHDEVRIAREVTHPNVCRVHDVVEADGVQFISMEYVDGEDLASLLRRIGRLPADKAVEVAHQLCAGLAAAHAHGVLHRDLKPANVMLDGRGRVRLTDFGLAVAADDGRSDDGTAGTPAYMAPEQALGRGVSARSDLYALGLVLYEVFTGRPAWHGRPLSASWDPLETPPDPSALVPDVPPAVDRIVQRCLEREPAARPKSALEVAAALPGGDPLLAARAAGETPSPEAVAAAGETGTLRPRAAVALLAAALASIGLAHGVRGVVRGEVVQHVALPKPPEVLSERAREILTSLGWTERTRYSARGFVYDVPLVRYFQVTDTRRLLAGRGLSWPAPIRFWYRESPAPLIPRWAAGTVREGDPPPGGFGSVSVALDPAGHLLELRVVPLSTADSSGRTAPDWIPLLRAAGLADARLREAEPRGTPPVPTDVRAAWVVVPEGESQATARVQAGAYGGRVVHFEILGPWSSPSRPAGSTGFVLELLEDGRGMSEGAIWSGGQFLGLVVLVLAGSFLLARRNLRLGRADPGGALRLGLFVAGIEAVSWLLGASHVADAEVEWGLFTRGLGRALADALLLSVFYLAAEPYVRRYWPESLVAWTRLVAGRVRDPLVGRDLLAGLLFGGAMLSVGCLLMAGPPLLGGTPRVSMHPGLLSLSGPLVLAGVLCQAPVFAIQTALLYLTLFLLLRVVVRRAWLAGLLFVMAGAVGTMGAFAWWLGPPHPVDWLVLGVNLGLILVVVSRFGLLALVGAFIPEAMAISMPWVSADPTAWTALAFYVPLAVFVLLAAWGFRTALAGQALLAEEA